MKRSLKIIAIAIAVLLVLACALAVTAIWLSERKQQRMIQIDVAPVAFITGDEVLAQGKYLYESRGCIECHGTDGNSKIFLDEPNGLFVQTPNITSGTGSVTAQYTERDWVRAIRHGVNPKSRPLLVMPSEDYNRMSDEDLGKLVAYTRSLPPRAGESAVIHFPLIVKALYAFGMVQDAAEKIDHHLPSAQPVTAAPGVEYGAYLANMCIGCHGPGFSGGRVPGAPPDWPPASNLTAGSTMAQYQNVDQFKNMFRTGKRPDGTEVSKVMPFDSLKVLNNTDVEALYAFIQTLPAKESGQR